MQGSLSTSPAWLQSALGWIASFVAGGTIFKLIDVWLNRKKPAAELQVTQATANEIKVRSHSTAGDALARMMDRLDQAQSTIDRLRGERDQWERKATDLNLDLEDSRNAGAEKDIRLKLHEYQMKRMKGLLDAHSISYSEVDRPRISDSEEHH